ncbi:MAG: hypothetical protein F6J93_19500 [Oscillatoria sp. SIO1A7]|nr:hypothetical protein [Oscillatoria sp. SIO1A7]
METWGHGDMETWRHGDMGTWRHGDMETGIISILQPLPTLLGNSKK